MPLQGKTLAEIAKTRGKDPIDTLFDLLIEDHGYTAVAVFGMSEPDVLLALKQPWVSVCNDSQGTSPEACSARSTRTRGPTAPSRASSGSTSARSGSSRCPDAIRKFTCLPAQRMRLADRGVLKQGMWADVVVFDPETIRTSPPSRTPISSSQGMDYVLVNGVPVIDGGKMTGKLPGKVLRGAGYRGSDKPPTDQARRSPGLVARANLAPDQVTCLPQTCPTGDSFTMRSGPPGTENA